jgi:hypothetical protein
MLRIIRSLIKPWLGDTLARFKNDLERPGEAQQRVLAQLIKSLSATEYGRAHKVRAFDGYDDFAQKVPIVCYDDLEEWVERQKKEEGSVLVSERVLFYEKTSGSSGPAKYIPYTKGLKESFNSMFTLWLCDLLDCGPAFDTGKLFISISPALASAQKTDRGIRIGLEDDSEYLSEGLRFLLKPFMVLPASIKRLQDPAMFKRAVAALLLAESRLEVASIWNPTMFDIILDYIHENREALSQDLRRGSVTCEKIEFKFKPVAASRLKLLEQAPVEWAEVWPHLKLISCWTGAHSDRAARRLVEKFPGVFIQGKGLLATEAPMTIPLIEARGFVPLPAELFYEFLDKTGRVRLLHDLEAGQEYEIVATQKGGLYRYRIGDCVKVTHYYRSTACLEFTGRSDAVCDMVGEKLNESFVQSCLSRFFVETGSFQSLLPVQSGRGASYYLLLADRLPQSAGSFEEALDEALCGAFHYRNARLLGQLGRARVIAASKARDIYYDYFTSKGVKLGDIKHSYLIRDISDAANIIKKLNGLA